MTEKTPKTSPSDQVDQSLKKQTPAKESADLDKPSPDKNSASKASKSTPGASKPAFVSPAAKQRRTSSVIAMVLAIIALALAGGVWYQNTVSEELIAKLETQSRASSEQAGAALQQAEQALASLSQQSKKINELSTGLRESKSSYDSLNDAFQLITDRGSDLVLLNDIDHLVIIAQQQLQLSGNVANAIISLETAQAQLARANRPALASLQQTINGDLDRLRATSTVDIALLSGRLDELASLVTQAPLLVPDDAVPSPIESPFDSVNDASDSSALDSDAASNVWWKNAFEQTTQWATHALQSMRHDMGQFVSVRRVDDATALLISPDQATRFRDNLRLRIMTAQLALMMGQPQIWATETEALVQSIQSRFDLQSALTRRALKIARDVADTAIDTPLPDVTNSIKALEAIREKTGDAPQSETQD